MRIPKNSLLLCEMYNSNFHLYSDILTEEVQNQPRTVRNNTCLLVCLRAWGINFIGNDSKFYIARQKRILRNMKHRYYQCCLEQYGEERTESMHPVIRNYDKLSKHYFFTGIQIGYVYNYTYRIGENGEEEDDFRERGPYDTEDLIEDFTEDFCILKTVWIRIFQRKFRNWLKKKRKLMAPKNIMRRQITGRTII